MMLSGDEKGGDNMKFNVTVKSGKKITGYVVEANNHREAKKTALAANRKREKNGPAATFSRITGRNGLTQDT